MEKVIYADLDALIEERVNFKFQGKAWTIKPISAVTFMQFSNALAEVNAFMKTDKPTPEQAVDKYAALIGAVCPEFDKAMILQCTQEQVAALFQLCLDTVSGRVQGEAGKKKVTTGPSQK